jgi:hypothetical protein
MANTLWPGIFELFPVRESLLSDIPDGEGKNDGVGGERMFTLTTKCDRHYPSPSSPPDIPQFYTLSSLSGTRTHRLFLLQEKQVKEEEERKTRIQLYVFILRYNESHS